MFECVTFKKIQVSITLEHSLKQTLKVFKYLLYNKIFKQLYYLLEDENQTQLTFLVISRRKTMKSLRTTFKTKGKLFHDHFMFKKGGIAISGMSWMSLFANLTIQQKNVCVCVHVCVCECVCV